MNLFRSQADRDLELLSTYLDNALPAKDAARLEVRLQDEPELRIKLAELRGTRRLLLELPVLPVPRNFTLRPEDVGATIQPVNMPWMRWATAAVAFAFVFVLAADAFTTLGFGATRDSTAAQVETFLVREEALSEPEDADVAVVQQESLAEPAVAAEAEEEAVADETFEEDAEVFGLAELPAAAEPEAELRSEGVIVDAVPPEEAPLAGFATGDVAAEEAVAESEDGSAEVHALDTATAAATATPEPVATVTPTITQQPPSVVTVAPTSSRTKQPSPVPTFAPPPIPQGSFDLRVVLRLFELCLGGVLIALLIVAFVRRRRTR